MRLAALALLVPTAAHADGVSTSGVEVGTGAFAGEWLGDAHSGAIPRGLVAGNLGALRLAGEYDFIDFSTAENRKGTVHRLAATLRYTDPTYPDRGLSMGWYAEAGVGREMARWDLGGSSTRLDVSLGVGWRFTGRLIDHPRRRIGYALGLHVVRAPAFPSGIAAHGPLAAPPADLAISLATEVTLY